MCFALVFSLPKYHIFFWSQQKAFQNPIFLDMEALCDMLNYIVRPKPICSSCILPSLTTCFRRSKVFCRKFVMQNYKIEPIMHIFIHHFSWPDFVLQLFWQIVSLVIQVCCQSRQMNHPFTVKVWNCQGNTWCRCMWRASLRPADDKVLPLSSLGTGHICTVALTLAQRLKTPCARMTGLVG